VIRFKCMKKRNSDRLIKIIFVVFVLLFVIPMLSAMLSIICPIADLIEQNEDHYQGYEGTKNSFFYVEDPEKAQQDFEDIAYYFVDREDEWKDEFYKIIKTAANPGEAAKVLNKELHIDITGFSIDINELYEEVHSNKN